VQLAVMAGARVLATCGPADADHCRGAGAAEVLDYADPALGERVRELAPDGLDLYVDTSGRINLELAATLLLYDLGVRRTPVTRFLFGLKPVPGSN
jgi:NADPH:quinone reductase-like Zn-dependent oxidoreductase